MVYRANITSVFVVYIWFSEQNHYLEAFRLKGQSIEIKEMCKMASIERLPFKKSPLAKLGI